MTAADIVYITIGALSGIACFCAGYTAGITRGGK